MSSSAYAWGSNKYKQAVPSKNELHVYSPFILDDFESPFRVACGDNHSLILSDFGDIYSYGRGTQGELGHVEKTNLNVPKVISGLAHEVCVEIACGSSTSYAVTASGKVYQWGLVLHENNNNNSSDDTNNATDDNTTANNINEDHNAASGELTGLAQDQSTTFVPIDTEARQYQQLHASQLSSNPNHHNNNNNNSGSSTNTSSTTGQVPAMQQPPQQAARQLRDIVKDSTERWLMQTDGADEEYFRELQSMGYQNEAVQEMMDQRGKEYHGMLRLGCRRTIALVPQLIKSIQHLKILKISAGYAHCMLLTDMGHLYAAGYNDRGQLGLGHRISTSEFKWVDFLAAKFVVQVVCGQQHTLCRAIDRNRSINNTNSSSSSSSTVNEQQQLQSVMINNEEAYVGSRIGTDCYSWGNGMLGQLGLGRRGTSKGRLLPTLIPFLFEHFPLGICDIAAGHMFSVTVNKYGQVYSFGHAEYNQHGTGGSANRDYNDPYHFFIPRQVMIMKPSHNSNNTYPMPTTAVSNTGTTNDNNNIDDGLVKMVSVQCGSNYSIGIDIYGNAYSWGWNESGVLGHGIGYFSSAPSKINLQYNTSHTGSGGMSGSGNIETGVSEIATGAKHVLAITTMTGFKTSSHFRYLLSLDGINEMNTIITNNTSMPKFADVIIMITENANSSGGNTTTVIPRVKYFPVHRVILAARSAYFKGLLVAEELDRQSQSQIQQSYMYSTESANVTANNFTVTNDTISYRTVIDLTDITCANTITLTSLLEYLYLDKINVIEHKRNQFAELAKYLCITSLYDVLVNKANSVYKYESHQQQSSSNTNNTNNDGKNNQDESMSIFNKDMSKALDDPSHLFSDVIFTLSTSTNNNSNENNSNSNTISMDITATNRSTNMTKPLFYAHKCILSQIDYFDALFHSHFKECSSSTAVMSNITNSSTASNTFDPNNTASNSNTNMMEISLDGFVADGIEAEIFYLMLKYAYTGNIQFTNITNSSGASDNKADAETDNNLNESLSQMMIESNDDISLPSTVSVTTTANNDIAAHKHNSDDDDIHMVVDDNDNDNININVSEDMHITMSLLVACNRLGYHKLAMLCEKELTLHLRDVFPANAQNCLAFSRAYNLPRLERQCIETLRYASNNTATTNTAVDSTV